MNIDQRIEKKNRGQVAEWGIGTCAGSTFTEHPLLRLFQPTFRFDLISPYRILSTQNEVGLGRLPAPVWAHRKVDSEWPFWEFFDPKRPLLKSSFLSL